MPDQLTFGTQADSAFETRRAPTRRDVFLAEMDKLVPWSALCGDRAFLSEDQHERRPVELERMLRIHFLQQWYAWSEPAVEEALYDSAAMRRFVGIDLGREPVPDERTACKFRHLLGKHGPVADLFAVINRYPHYDGMRLPQGTIADATIINASSSTKNRDKQRNPQVRQTKKGNQ